MRLAGSLTAQTGHRVGSFSAFQFPTRCARLEYKRGETKWPDSCHLGRVQWCGRQRARVGVRPCVCHSRSTSHIEYNLYTEDT